MIRLCLQFYLMVKYEKNQTKILREQCHFYRELYTANESIEFNIQNSTGIGLNASQKEFLDSDLSLDELYNAAKDMKINKVCGCDGLPLEFYLKFWESLKDDLWAMYIHSFQEGHFGYSTRKGVISLLPKKGKDPRLIKNLHPLTLLNTDYKILAKALATRLKKVLPTIIGPYQTEFMSGRHIQNNIRKTMDIVHHIDKSGQKAVIMSIDFEKCFDRIEHKSIYGAMSYFNIGLKFISWTKLFFTEFLLFTCNAGQTSSPFIKGRGVNQGCPISPFCYNLYRELLAQRIINNPKIVGVRMSDAVKGEVEYNISQFADDTCLYLQFSKECIQEVINELMYIESNTGLKISYEKNDHL